jgi:hypothetical protein
MAYSGREYSSRVTMSLSQVKTTARAQRVIYDSGIVTLDSNKLTSGLSAATNVISLVFAAKTPYSLAAAIASLVTSFNSSAKATLERLVKDGYWELGYLQDFLEDRPQYDLIDVELPFIEYNVDGERVRFITGRGVVKRVHSKSGWITL